MISASIRASCFAARSAARRRSRESWRDSRGSAGRRPGVSLRRASLRRLLRGEAAQVVVVVAVEVAEPSGAHFDDARRDGVHKRAVVGDEEQRAGVAAQRVFEHLAGADVEMVGRLVEHQEVRGAQQAASRARGAPSRRPRARRPSSGRRRPRRGRRRGGRAGAGRPRASRRAPARRAPCAAGRALRAGAGRRRPTRTWWPSRRTPRSRASAPAAMRSSVDLPAPFGPTSATRSPRRTSKSRPFVDHAFAVALRDAFERQHHLAGARGLGDLQAHAPRARRQAGAARAIHALEHLHAALHLACLRRLGAEALDEALDLGALLRLLALQRLRRSRCGRRALSRYWS